jgi:hypothetical protein
MSKGKRGASEVLGAIIITVIVMAMSATYVMLEAGRSTRETMGIVELIRAAEKKQKQLLSLTYYYKQGSSLKLYIYNYGDETSTPKMILIEQEVPLSSVSMRNMDTDDTCNNIPPKILVEIALPAPDQSTFTLALFTEEGGFYSWRITV